MRTHTQTCACTHMGTHMQAKELETCAAAKARLEEAFSRSMSELRWGTPERGVGEGKGAGKVD